VDHRAADAPDDLAAVADAGLDDVEGRVGLRLRVAGVVDRV
jgi:hypothetical protein